MTWGWFMKLGLPHYSNSILPIVVQQPPNIETLWKNSAISTHSAPFLARTCGRKLLAKPNPKLSCHRKRPRGCRVLRIILRRVPHSINIISIIHILHKHCLLLGLTLVISGTIKSNNYTTDPSHPISAFRMTIQKHIGDTPISIIHWFKSWVDTRITILAN